MPAEARFLALRDRAYAFVAAHGSVSEEVLLEHVYGGATPPGLRAQLLAPLLDDPRYRRQADGTWRLAESEPVVDRAYTALAVVATGPSPERGRIVCVAALHVQDGAVVERFMATVHPGRRVPGYVAERLGLDPAVLDALQPFETVCDEFAHFLGTRPIVAQDAALAWAFVDAEARRAGRVLAEPVLADLNALATGLLELDDKPTLARVAARLGMSTVRIAEPEEEARVLVGVTNRLLRLSEGGLSELAAGLSQPRDGLRRASTARALPDRPGVYTMRDVDRNPLYVGKARRLRSRVSAYVNRLGATRRLEGLVGSVESVDPQECETDLEALVLEEREIRRLGPRFNTVRQQRAPRLWIRLPPTPGARRAALRRLELAVDSTGGVGEFVGPFRNETAAEQARSLAREVFELDALRRSDPFAYEARLAHAWRFLHGHADAAESLARPRSTRLLRQVLAFDVAALLLPADPRAARYAVVRPARSGVEGFVIDRAVCVGWHVLEDAVDALAFAADLLGLAEARTAPEDADVVLRWLGAQRPPARLLHLPDDPLIASDALVDAALDVWPTR